jgi:predicted unusual protein kinase regulating ubiquinone biosynthesis (AarF/ABC1/UbiB family)
MSLAGASLARGVAPRRAGRPSTSTHRATRKSTVITRVVPDLPAAVDALTHIDVEVLNRALDDSGLHVLREMSPAKLYAATREALEPMLRLREFGKREDGTGELVSSIEWQGAIDVAVEALKAARERFIESKAFGAATAAFQTFGVAELLPEDAVGAALQAIAVSMAGVLAITNSGDEAEESAAAIGLARGVEADALPTTYDVAKIRAYWSRRPAAITKRSGSLLADVMGWVLALLLDIQTGKVEKNSVERAGQLKELIAKQGPAFVKVGQAVAIRPDLLPPAYLEALQTLLDGVKPFSSVEARELIRQELGKPLEDVFEDVSAFEEPVAAASIGQVYKARLKATKVMEKEQGDWGMDVAVKVQRPAILEVVTLDLLVIRSVLESLASLPKEGPLGQIQQGAEGFLPVLDVAAERFLEELDFGLEASNASRFEADMNSVPFVRGTIKVPHVFRSCSTGKVLTQEWVAGRKLTEIEASNTNKETREKLVETLLNSYMVQFLETGFLHADPHPGNFLLEDNGRLCILDYGMMTTISEEQRIAFVEYIAHLSAKEYDKTLGDLVNLGFVPPELANDPVSRSIVVPVLAETLETLYGTGGGITAKTDALNAQQSSRVGELSEKLDDLAKQYPLSLPPYFVLILRAFGTLEGLGLSVDSNYAIVDECFPYIARRLLSDDSPRMRAALRSFVYGGSDRLKVSRVKDIAGGFSKFTNSMGATESLTIEDAKVLSELDPATRDALSIVFSGEGNYLQDLVVEEAVRAADSLSRNGATQAWQLLGSASPFATLATITPLALVPGLNASIFLSILASQNKDAIALTFDDKKNLALLRALVELAAGPSGGSVQSLDKIFAQLPGAANGVSRIETDSIRAILPTVAPGVQRMSNKFIEKFQQRLAERTRDDLSKFPIPGRTPSLQRGR